MKRDQSSRSEGTALVTGASGGIGLEIARELAARGYDLVLVARRRDRLEELAGRLEGDFAVRCLVVTADLASEEGLRAVATAVDEAGLDVDILVNNAGVGHYAPFAETEAADHLAVVRLNVLAATALCAEFVPRMVERGTGRVLNVASVAAFQPTPLIAVYGATKAFLLSLTEALSVELEGTGVTATVTCPGFTGTEMIENLTTEAGDPAMLPDFALLDPRDVARESVEACLGGQAVHVSGAGYRLGLLWESWQPRWLVRSLGGAIARAMRPPR